MSSLLNYYSKTWLIQNSIIQNIAIIQILVGTYIPRRKIHINLPGYFKNLDNL
jgi:hypothetical protein